MLRIGITGGIGSGKTTVCRVFQVLEVPVFEADAEGRRILAEDPAVREAVTGAFGAEAYPQGGPDRGFLARTVFSDSSARARLNAIVHPAVRTAFARWAAEQDAPYVLMESALLADAGAIALDGLVLVTAPAALRLQRTMARDGADEQAVRARMAAQPDEERMRAAATQVIINDDRRPVIPQVLEVHQAQLQRAAR